LSTVEGSAAPGGTLETARVVAASEVGNLAAALNSATEGQNGYATENQRFLHVTVSAANGKSVAIYVYNYAVGVWAPLMVNDGDGTFSQAAASTVATATANLQPQHFIFEIAGVDRVAFVSADAPTVHASCSTF
tara:strand:+ start:85 stop:486 length:402 start_codon:yes stop_codon:yes gene_type:complete